jgi:hypothetical protein
VKISVSLASLFSLSSEASSFTLKNSTVTSLVSKGN